MRSATYEAIESLRLVNCRECGVLYAVPLAMLSAVALLHCPNGHTWTLTPADSQTTIAGLYSALADARTRLEAARLRIEALTPLAEPSLAELRRRSRVLAEHAEDAGQGRAVCPYCGASKGRARLAEHLRRQHRQLLVEGGGDQAGVQ